MIYEVPRNQFWEFPRELFPGGGPTTYIYDDMPNGWYQQFRGYYRPDGTASLIPFSVTANWVDFDITPLYSDWMLVLDVGWTRWWIPPPSFTCSGWGVIL